MVLETISFQLICTFDCSMGLTWCDHCLQVSDMFSRFFFVPYSPPFTCMHLCTKPGLWCMHQKWVQIFHFLTSLKTVRQCREPQVWLFSQCYESETTIKKSNKKIRICNTMAWSWLFVYIQRFLSHSSGMSMSKSHSFAHLLHGWVFY